MTHSSRVAGLLLAAGAGSRYGMPKALVEYHGQLFVELAARALTEGGCQPVIVVLGAQADEVRSRATLSGCLIVDCPQWRQGMSSSLDAGLATLTKKSNVDNVLAVAVLPVDVPGVTAAAVRRVLDMATPTALARATYHGVPGHPVLIGRKHWAGVRATATGDVGARDYLRANPVTDIPCADIAVGRDVDRPGDLPDRP